MPNEKKAKSKCVEYLRHAEYYDMQSTFDELYARSQAGEIFENLMDVILSRENILLAYRNIKSNTGSITPGTDKLEISDIGKLTADEVTARVRKIVKGAKNGYTPRSVRRKDIPKPNGNTRPLGIPCIWDRLVQQCIKQVMEPICEAKFHERNNGFRPYRSTQNAIAQCYKMAQLQNLHFVVDVDIVGFFDNIDHERLMLAVQKHVPEKWCLLYIQRWLTMPVQTKSGELIQKQGKGTPQGGVISPLLANLFLHYAMDKWLEQNHPNVEYVRYADDAILHCKTKTEAEQTLAALDERMKACGLELHPEKTKQVYCRDYRRQNTYETVKFDFLGYSFQPRSTKSKQTGKLFLGFDCAISISSKKRIADKLEDLKIDRLNFKSIVGVALYLEPFIRGWINYYGKYRITELKPVFLLLRQRLVWWARKRYKRYKTNMVKAYRWLDRVQKQFPNLFYQWRYGFA